MRPILQDSKIKKKLWIVYIIIFIICTCGIGVALYLQFFKDEKVEIVFGITDSNSEDQDEYNELKAEFNTLFTNDIENIQEREIQVEKINDKFDVVVTAYKYKKNEENCTLNVEIPYINIKTQNIMQIDQQIRKQYKEKAEELLDQTNTVNIVYSVEYKAYIQNNILSLIIRSEYKEGAKNQKITIETYNYNLIENREVSIEEMLQLKNIDISYANNKIKKEIKSIQEQNQPLIEQGYNFYERDYTSDIYKVTNSKQFFLGKNGMLYIIYSYGIEENTSEMDIVIFK